jgi:tetratricopeptide (TPR) repeat protein
MQIAQFINEGDSLVRNGQLDEGIAKYEEALKSSPQSDAARAQLGIAYYLHRGFPRDMAPQQLQLATQANPMNGPAWDFLGLSLLTVATEYQTGDFNSAEQACRAALKLNLKDPQAHAFLARILAAQGRFEEAQPEMQTALDLAPKDPWVLVSAGWVGAMQSKWAESISYYEQAIATRPKWANFLHLYAEALRESGQYEQALGCYQSELLMGQGYEAAAHEGIGVTLWKAGDLAGAVTNLNAALALDNTSHYAHWALGAVLDEQGLYELALPHLQVAVTAIPGSAGYQEWLGDCLYNLGRYEEARAAVDKSLGIDANRTGAQRISGLLQQKGY